MRFSTQKLLKSARDPARFLRKSSLINFEEKRPSTMQPRRHDDKDREKSFTWSATSLCSFPGHATAVNNGLGRLPYGSSDSSDRPPTVKRIRRDRSCVLSRQGVSRRGHFGLASITLLVLVKEHSFEGFQIVQCRDAVFRKLKTDYSFDGAIFSASSK